MKKGTVSDPSAPRPPDFLELADTLDLGLFITSLSGEITWANEAMARQYGCGSVEELTGTSAGDYYADPRERRELFAQFLSDPNVREMGAVRFEGKRKRKNTGEVFDALLSVKVVFGEDGSVLRLEGVSEDIGARKQAERIARANAERFHRVFDDSVLGMAVADESGAITRVNEAFCRFLESEEDALLGRPFDELVHPLDRTEWFPLRSVPATAPADSWQTEKRFVRSDGEFAWGYAAITRLHEEDQEEPQQAVVMVQDVTLRKRLEDDLLRVEKLESLAVLSGGIAHDFNNILTAVLGHLSVVCGDAGLDDAVRRHVEQAQAAALRARGLTLQLSTFAKGGAPVRRAGSIETLLRNTSQFCLAGSAVRCDIQIQGDLPMVEFDTGQLNQALSSILTNAEQAMPDGGTVQIKARTAQVDRESPLPLKAGTYVVIDVVDHGVGIPAACVDRIFDPYFSTKQSGSGLGLATAYSIIRKHEGQISVFSRPEEGSTFRIHLPATTPGPARTNVPPERAASTTAGRVLVMDDEEAVREVARAILTSGGFDVETVSDGDAALAAYESALEEGAPFDVVILDLTVPAGRGGAETIGPLHAVDPEVVALVSSGYSADEIMASHRDYGFQGVVPKPYTADELRDAVQAFCRRP